MIYLMSDVHGCSSLFFEMLEHISFGISDRMYILGDLVGKGPDSLGLLRCVMEDGRIRLLRGNHEQRLLQALGVDLEAGISREILEEWEREDGSAPAAFRNLRRRAGQDSGVFKKYAVI